MADVILRSPFNGGTIVVPSDDPHLPVLLQAGFTRLEPPKKEKRAHG